MRLLGQRPRYQEGPPEGAGHVGWPLGGEEFSGPRPSRLVARPERPAQATPPASPRPPEDRRRRTSPASPRSGGASSRAGAEPEARRIARSSSGRTAREKKNWASAKIDVLTSPMVAVSVA